MRPTRLATLVLLLALAACAAQPTELALAPSLLIDQPTPAFPYNSRFCP